MTTATDRAKRRKSRLGKGLSGLIGEPVSVGGPANGKETDTPPTPEQTPNSAPLQPRAEAADEGLARVPVSGIVPSPYQPRRAMDDGALGRLAESIRRSGVMQPVLVRRRGSGQYELVAGERRWRAAEAAGLSHVPAMVMELSDEEAAQAAIVENLQREDLNPMERAWAFRSLGERFGLSQSEVAERVGFDRSTVANLVRLTELEEGVCELISSGKLTAGHGKALLGFEAGPGRVALAVRAARESWSVRRLERAAKPGKGASGPAPAGETGASLRELERQLGEHLGTRVSIKADRTGARGRIGIEFYSLDHFDDLMARLGFSMR